LALIFFFLCRLPWGRFAVWVERRGFDPSTFSSLCFRSSWTPFSSVLARMRTLSDGVTSAGFKVQGCCLDLLTQSLIFYSGLLTMPTLETTVFKCLR
jgi:hypothetical protein